MPSGTQTVSTYGFGRQFTGDIPLGINPCETEFSARSGLDLGPGNRLLDIILAANAVLVPSRRVLVLKSSVQNAFRHIQHMVVDHLRRAAASHPRELRDKRLQLRNYRT